MSPNDTGGGGGHDRGGGGSNTSGVTGQESGPTQQSHPRRHSPSSRPPLVQQHSRSVPTTPHQHARRRSSHSRSPSPVGALGSQSPRSVSSEAPRSFAPSTKPVPTSGCKYETAMTQRRRFMYTEGGDKPLGKAKETPKVALEPHEEDKLSGDMRELYDRLLPTQESIARRTTLVQKLERMLNEEWPGSNIKVHVFGSSGHMLSSNESDVDICITTTKKELERVCALAAVLAKRGMQRVVCVASAKVPIVKIWDPEVNLACDLNVNNTDALENTRMIKTYVQIDDRVRPLAMIIKHWASRRIINDAAMGGTISSYTWLCMVLNFLQTRHPPVLPTLHQMPQHAGTKPDGTKSPFADNLDALCGFGAKNKESLGSLLFHFFRFYGHEINYEREVVSVRLGKRLTRIEKGWTGQTRLCVEEPFNTARNLGNSADDYSFHGIHSEIRKAFTHLADNLPFETLCEQYEFPAIEVRSTIRRSEPKARPILSRSASQSRRPSAGSSTLLNGHRGNYNGQRHGGNNRRMSGGNAFNNNHGRYSLPQSPPVVPFSHEYFQQLNESFLQRFQSLQAQEEMLRQHLAQTQQSQARDSSGLGAHAPILPLSFQNSLLMTSPGGFVRSGVGSPPFHSPLLPGVLYHHPATQSPPHQHSQNLGSSTTSTNPSSPTIRPANPAVNRVHRSTVTGNQSGSAVRSQSQPGRSAKHPITGPANAHPGFDMSGAIGYPMGSPPNIQHTFAPIPDPAQGYAFPQPGATATPPESSAREYYGYYLADPPQGATPVATTRNLASMLTFGSAPPMQRRREAETSTQQQQQTSPPVVTSDPPTIAGLGGFPLSRQSTQSMASTLDTGPTDDSTPPIVNGSTPSHTSHDPSTASLTEAMHGLGIKTTGSHSVEDAAALDSTLANHRARSLPETFFQAMSPTSPSPSANPPIVNGSTPSAASKPKMHNYFPLHVALGDMPQPHGLEGESHVQMPVTHAGLQLSSPATGTETGMNGFYIPPALRPRVTGQKPDHTPEGYSGLTALSPVEETSSPFLQSNDSSHQLGATTMPSSTLNNTVSTKVNGVSSQTTPPIASSSHRSNTLPSSFPSPQPTNVVKGKENITFSPTTTLRSNLNKLSNSPAETIRASDENNKPRARPMSASQAGLADFQPFPLNTVPVTSNNAAAAGSTTAPAAAATQPNGQPNGWQQQTGRKGRKRSKPQNRASSTGKIETGTRSLSFDGGERKGG